MRFTVIFALLFAGLSLTPTVAQAAPPPTVVSKGKSPGPGAHPLSDAGYQLHTRRMRLGGGLIGGSIGLFATGGILVAIGAKRDHPEPLCTSFSWTGPLVTCDAYESETQFDDRHRTANLLKGSGIVSLFLGAGMLGTGLGIYFVNRRGRERRLDKLFGPLQGLRLTPAGTGRGARVSWSFRF